ncbi:CBS domain protein [Ancylostoma duodenale]|uniref:CBS domain protein n=1 Tax=Ancylostoma duodenale TaxID=51022 RepID=A0A0C2H4X0_9BILA|nr:CBS domain protein [Ancylostoma duodenale]
MATNNKVIVFTDDLSVRKAFYALVSNSTRTGLIADSATMNLTGVLSITDFTMCSCLSRPDYMYESACDLKVGTYTEIHYATQEMSLLEVLDMMIDNSISGVPIVEESTMKSFLFGASTFSRSFYEELSDLYGAEQACIMCGFLEDSPENVVQFQIIDVYTRFDAVSAALSRTIDMSITVAEAIRQRHRICGDRDGVVTAPERVTMWDLVETFVEKNVHRIFLIDNFQRLKVRATKGDCDEVSES